MSETNGDGAEVITIAKHDLKEQLARAWEAGLNTGIGYSLAQRVVPDAPEPENPFLDHDGD